MAWYKIKSMDVIPMRAFVFGTGSKGNCTLIKTNKTNILVDLGLTSLSVERQLLNLEIDPFLIDGIILTHTHTDHIEGIKVFTKKYKTKTYLTEKMLMEINEKFELKNYSIITDDFSIKDIDIEIFKTSHDTLESNGYVFNNEEDSIVYVTDTGYLPVKLYDKIKNKTTYIFESNHDGKMLLEGRYPHYLKQRICGDKGHLSNKDSAYHLSKLIGDKTKNIVLIHLSEENNDPKIAYDTLISYLPENNINIKVSTQAERVDV